MCRLLFTCFTLVVVFCLKANDGAYLGSGNQLIPMVESDISVQKEVLTITRNSEDKNLVDISVYYEFYNSGKQKTITVGFEAMSPGGDVYGDPVNGGHPYMTNFTASINKKVLPYEIAIVKDSIYYQNGKFKTLTADELSEWSGSQSPDFFYVYHFDMIFEPDVNIVEHTYTYALSGSIDQVLLFEYMLTPATRWANKQIDDFTLKIDMGKGQLLHIVKSFFDDSSEWIIEGVATAYDERDSFLSLYHDKDIYNTSFFINRGAITFKKKNFKPKGELYIYTPLRYLYGDFDYREEDIPANISYGRDIKPIDEISLKIIRNIPFAYKGYVFKSPELQKYFENQYWYSPEPTYIPNLNTLLEEEREWVEYWTNYKIEAK